MTRDKERPAAAVDRLPRACQAILYSPRGPRIDAGRAKKFLAII
jgi:hypothetical protein